LACGPKLDRGGWGLRKPLRAGEERRKGRKTGAGRWGRRAVKSAEKPTEESAKKSIGKREVDRKMK
jgi:hypothetical protein